MAEKLFFYIQTSVYRTFLYWKQIRYYNSYKHIFRRVSPAGLEIHMKRSFVIFFRPGISSALAAAAGLLLLFYPRSSVLGFAIVSGLLMAFYGLYRLVRLLRCRDDLQEPVPALAVAGLLILAGLLCFFAPMLLMELLPFIAGLLLLVYGLLRILMIRESWPLGNRERLGAILWAALPIAAGVLLLSEPFKATLVLACLLGLALLLFGLKDIFLGPED